MQQDENESEKKKKAKEKFNNNFFNKPPRGERSLVHLVFHHSAILFLTSTVIMVPSAIASVASW